MKIDWDVPVRMDDGLVLRADVFRPAAEGRYPVILSYGPYGKGLAFQEGYKTAWEIMARDTPDAAPGARRAICATTTRARRATSTCASGGRRCKPGAAEKWV